MRSRRNRSFHASQAALVALLAVVVTCAVSRAEAASPAAPVSSGGGELRFQRTPRWTGAKPRFWTHDRLGAFFLAPDELTYWLPGAAPRGEGEPQRDRVDPRRTVTLTLVGANRLARAELADPLPGVSNYFIGDDPRDAEAGVPGFATLRFSGVYPGIDVVYRSNQGRLEYDFVVAPGANPRVIALRPTGARGARVDDAGDLVLVTGEGELRHARPVVYQDIRGERRTVGGSFVLGAGGVVSFRIDPHDTSAPLVIDPMVNFVSYFGGAGSDGGLAVASDRLGGVVIGGSQQIGAGQGFVRKIDRGKLVWETYIGGSGADGVRGVAVDAALNTYITGFTTSSNLFTTAGVFSFNCPKKFGSSTCPNKLGLVGKLDPNGLYLAGKGWLSYLGGTTSDEGWAIAVNSAGDAFVVGDARSNDFPASKIIRPPTPTTGGVYPTDDGFLAHVTPDGSKLDYIMYLGGTDLDYARAIAYSPNGPAGGVLAIAGHTYSHDFPASLTSIQPASSGLIDGYVVKVYGNPAALSPPPVPTPILVSYVGGSSNDLAMGVALDPTGAVYVSGTTASTDFPFPAQWDPKLGIHVT